MNQLTALCQRQHCSAVTVLITYVIAFNMFYWRTHNILKFYIDIQIVTPQNLRSHCTHTKLTFNFNFSAMYFNGLKMTISSRNMKPCYPVIKRNK